MDVADILLPFRLLHSGIDFDKQYRLGKALENVERALTIFEGVHLIFLTVYNVPFSLVGRLCPVVGSQSSRDRCTS